MIEQRLPKLRQENPILIRLSQHEHVRGIHQKTLSVHSSYTHLKDNRDEELFSDRLDYQVGDECDAS